MSFKVNNNKKLAIVLIPTFLYLLVVSLLGGIWLGDRITSFIAHVFVIIAMLIGTTLYFILWKWQFGSLKDPTNHVQGKR